MMDMATAGKKLIRQGEKINFGLAAETPLLDQTSDTNISEISFPSHVSGLESFSDFDKTINSSMNEDNSPRREVPDFSLEETYKLGLSPYNDLNDKQKTIRNARQQFSMHSPVFEGASCSSVTIDPLDLSLGFSDLKSPSSDSEKMVAKFLGHETMSELAITVKPANISKTADQNQLSLQNTATTDTAVSGDVDLKAKELSFGDKIAIGFSQHEQSTNIGDNGLDELQVGGLQSVAFEVGMETQQRPGLDGSSSDSDDGATMNFARSRIGTAYQQQQTTFIDERPPEERQLAEGDDVFSRDAPGDGGGGGDGSSGHSDSDADGDGGVAIRVRHRRSHNSRNRTAPDFLPNPDQSERALPERERPVGDSVPVSNQQWRVQFLGNGSTNQDDDTAVIPTHSRNDSLTPLDLDSSQDSRLSARFLIASSTPGQALRHHSTQQNNWMDENSTFRLSESSPATPRNSNAESMPSRNSISLNTPVPEPSSNIKRDVLGDDNEEEDTTIVDGTGGLSVFEDLHENSNGLQKENIQAPSFMQNPDSSNYASTDPFRFPVMTTNPFTAETFCKNPFDHMDANLSGAKAFVFSGFGDKNDTGIENSDFKLNSQEADALFDEDEKSFEHSNTVSKLANLTEGSEWNLDETHERGEVRLSKYFNAFSEELGSFSLDREDRPRPIFDDYKAVKTPPALEHPAVLYKEAWYNADAPMAFPTSNPAFSPSSPANNTLISDDKCSADHELADHNAPDFDTQTEADRDNYGVRGDGFKIDLPTTNGEAESLLHDIEVGRVSLKGISGVNISNLAAKIAVATNSDPNFILKLLITLIEAEKFQDFKVKSDFETLSEPFSKKAAFKHPPEQATSDSEHSPKRNTSAEQETATKRGPVDDPTGATMQLHKHKEISKTFHFNPDDAPRLQDSSSLKLSDLDRGPTLATQTPTVTSSNHSDFAVKEVIEGRYLDSYGKSLTSTNKDVISAVSSSISTTSTQLTMQKATFPKTPTTSVATIRPVSSVIPLIASTETKASYRNSAVQCHTNFGGQQKRKIESDDKLFGIRGSKSADEASQSLQSNRNKEQGIASLLPQTMPTLTETRPRLYDSPAALELPYGKATRHLSSTAIFGDDSEEANPTRDIELSPVAIAAESPYCKVEDPIWKPLKQSQAVIKSETSLTKANNLLSSCKPQFVDNEENSLKILKISGEEIHGILPRFSDIRVRESVATFYPVMTVNQTVLQGQTIDTRPDEQSIWKDKQTEQHPQSLYRNHSLAKKQPIPQVQIVVPNEVTFSGVQCVGVAINQCLPVHNPSSRWIQCLIEVSFYSVNGAQAGSSEVCAFSLQPKMFLAPHTTEDVKITFYAEHAGVFMAKLNVIASAVVSDDSNLSDEDLFPNIVHMEAVAELPNVEVVQEKDEIINFGEMPGGLSRTKALKLINKGRANVPLKLVLSASYIIWKNFSFVNADMSPIDSSSENKFQDPADSILPPSLSIELPGGQQLGKSFTPVVVLIQFKAPLTQEKAVHDKLGPPQEFTARIDVEVDSKGSSIIIGSVLLKALVGIARLHAPRSLQALCLSTTEGQRVSRGVPFRNAGNISLDIHLQISTFTDLFSVIPDKVFLQPGESTEIFVHFQSPSSITVESFLLVTINPDGPQYEVVLRGTATVHRPIRQQEEKPILLCNKPVLCWAGIPIGRSMQQRAYLRNNSLHHDLIMTISVEGNHSDFQVQNTFDFIEKKQNAFEINLKPQSEVPVHVLFVPSTLGMISSALVIRPSDGGPKFRIPLHGYGGCSKLSLSNAQRIRDNYWIDAGEVSLGKQNIIKVALQNVGNRPAFIKIVCYSDVGKRQLYPSSHISVAPNDFVLAEKCTKQLVVVLQPTEAVLSNAKERPCTAACLAVFSGDECIRQLYRKSNCNSSERRISKEGPLQNLVFDSTFMDDDKITLDFDYPLVPNWENFFVSAVSRTVVSLIARPATQEMSPSKKPPALDPRDLVVTETPARPLPLREDDQSSSKLTSTKEPERKDNWTVSPEHIVLTAPNTVSDKSTARIQMINYSDKPLSFEFSWPAQSLIITPSKDSVPPRSQLIVFVSTKPSFVTTGGELPWRGCIYVQCEGVQKSVRIQIREDLALDGSPISSLGRRLTQLDPSSDINTPYQEKSSSKPKSLISVEPQSVIFPPTAVNRHKESFIRIENNGVALLKWVLSSIAPPYFKDATESGDIFRTTYTAFRFMKYSGSLQPKESSTIQVTFQPRDNGEYSQFWDLQAAIEATGDTGKSRIELRGTGLHTETDPNKKEVKKIGRAQPILKPAERIENEPEKGAKTAEKEIDEKSASRKPSEKRNRGVFVKDEIVNFKPTTKGETTEMQFRLCNDTMELQKVRLSGLKLPFLIKHNKLAIKSKSFIRIPVFFSPSEPGLKSEGHLEVTAVSGQVGTSYVKVLGICTSK